MTSATPGNIEAPRMMKLAREDEPSHRVGDGDPDEHGDRGRHVAVPERGKLHQLHTGRLRHGKRELLAIDTDGEAACDRPPCLTKRLRASR